MRSNMAARYSPSGRSCATPSAPSPSGSAHFRRFAPARAFDRQIHKFNELPA